MKILDVPQSGSVGGVTSSRNRFGQYRKTRVIPVNPNSAAQVAARGRLVEVSQAWRTMTEAQRDAWNALAEGRTFTDSLGQQVTLTGHQTFVSAGVTCLLCSESLPLEVPELPDFNAVAVAIDADNPEPTSFDLTITGPDNGTKVLLSATPGMPAGRGFYPPPTLLKVFTMAGGGAVSILTEYTARFGAPQVGMKVRVSAQQAVDGFRSALATAEAVVIETPP